MTKMNVKNRYIIYGGIIVSMIIIIVLAITFIIPGYYYGQGIKNLDSGEYSRAIESFESAKGYKDSAEKITLSTQALSYTNGIESLSKNDYSDAVDNLIKAENYSDAQQKLQDAADGAVSMGAWDVAILAYDALPNSESNEYRYYATGMQSMEEKDFVDALNNFKKVKTIEGIADKIAEANFNQGFKDYNSANYESAIKYFNASNGFGNAEELIVESSYEAGKDEFSKGNYESAIEYFNASNGFENAEELIIESSYEAGKIEFSEGNYESAINYFNASNGYDDIPDWLNKAKFMIAERKYKNSSYVEAGELYKELPSGFTLNGVNITDRLNAISLYEFFKKYEGTYKCTYGYIEVRQTSKSYGSWNNWYNKDKDGKLTISVKLNTDGTVTLEGEASGYKYTSYSVISAGVRSGYISAKFSEKLPSKSLPTTLYNENNMTIKNTGGTNFTFSYYNLVTNEDMYFNYKYASDYKFSK